jgi:hypothetical protein
MNDIILAYGAQIINYKDANLFVVFILARGTHCSLMQYISACNGASPFAQRYDGTNKYYVSGG